MAGGPPDEVRTRAEQDEDLFRARRGGAKSTLRAKPARRGRVKGCRWSDQALGASSPDPASLAAALVIRRETARERGVIETGTCPRRTGHLDRPDGSSDTLEVQGVRDAFVSQELGPRAIRRLGEVMHGSFPHVVPTSGILRSRLPQEGEAGIGVPKDFHVAAPTPAKAAASCRTLSTSWEAGSHSDPRTCRGERPSSCAR